MDGKAAKEHGSGRRGTSERSATFSAVFLVSGSVICLKTIERFVVPHANDDEKTPHILEINELSDKYKGYFTKSLNDFTPLVIAVMT